MLLAKGAQRGIAPGGAVGFFDQGHHEDDRRHDEPDDQEAHGAGAGEADGDFQGAQPEHADGYPCDTPGLGLLLGFRQDALILLQHRAERAGFEFHTLTDFGH